LTEKRAGEGDRRSEWFVPKFGPPRFRTAVGLLFLPYTGMVISYTVIGSMMAPRVYWERVLAMAVIYFLGLGIAAHALDALGSKHAKPWGDLFTRRGLWAVAIASLGSAYLIAVYYMLLYVPMLWIAAILEAFFVFAYNLEWFQGRFHTDRWFAFSWGFLPVLAGYIMQTNSVSIEVLILASAMGLFSIVEIKASRPYKDLKRRSLPLQEEERLVMKRYEAILKSVSLGVILLGLGMLIWRVNI